MATAFIVTLVGHAWGPLAAIAGPRTDHSWACVIAIAGITRSGATRLGA